MANHLWMFSVGPGPVRLVAFVALETKRKSGWGICGSSWFVFLFVFLML